MFKKMESFFMFLAEKVGRNKYLLSIRDGFLVSMPLLIAGSFFLLIANFPIPGWTEFWGRIFGENWTTFMVKPTEATFNIMAIIVVMAIGYSFAGHMKVNKIFGAAISVVSWFLLMPYEVLVKGSLLISGVDTNVSGIPLKWVGSSGLFVGMIVAFLAVHIYAFANSKGWIIKMPDGVPPTVIQSFAALIPATLVITVFFVINIIFSFTPFENAFNFVFEMLQIPLLNLGNTVWAMVTAYIFVHIFWFIGVNGGSVVGAVYNPILQTLAAQNLEAFRTGEPIPNIISQQFQDLFATFGGAGSTLSLLIAMLLFCRSKRIKNLGKLSLAPGIFGINEPIIFGLPIVLNPIMFVPFLLVPTFNIVVSYIVMKIGLVPYPSGVPITWTTPIIVSGFLSTGWTGAVLQVLLLIAGVFIYMPFIKIMDKQFIKEEMKEIEDKDTITEEDLSFDDV
ncbi:PTS sugar transporter subunit IIC [Candidatus Arthromitus sp. SFB-turkey]|uniref:PTS sugar transporter subunit IIC n=1 Tax=Candidatus Arthromitus sp. SFB-turkey TaxID=1840217 RepID=UPI0007F52C58|nr:PTS sugar transporter subunit IIC [Candidatus Arthromitus sp. SFB-turkey]OAT89187.1 PTS cellobiose transporter subunit IIC [Candidatus Arthromitus sp. SFB-turkey]